jgi:hypothetical protein
MIVDRDLVDIATRLLQERFAHHRGRACAAYGPDGRVFGGVSTDGAGEALEPELGVIAEAAEHGQVLTALVTVAREGDGAPVTVRPPPRPIIERLLGSARRHAQIAMEGAPGAAVSVRCLWELIPHGPNSALLRGRYGGGMKAIGAELAALARDVGVPLARAELRGRLQAALRSGAIRRNAAAPGFGGSALTTPANLPSVALRHIWLALELAVEQLTDDLVESLRPRLAELGCNDADVVHVKQGVEALRNVLSALIVLAGTRREVVKESPFNPYDAFRLQHGLPIHLVVPFAEPPPGDTAARNVALVRQLIGALSKRGDGGFAHYLRQRELFKVDLFQGGGTGHCPFAALSTEIVFEAALGLDEALEGRLLLLAPDHPADAGHAS